MNEVHIPETEQVLAAVRSALGRLLAPADLEQVDLDSLSLNTPLLSLPVDSAVLMALMTELEDTFSVFIDEEAAFSFQSVGDIAEYIRQRLAGKARRLSQP